MTTFCWGVADTAANAGVGCARNGIDGEFIVDDPCYDDGDPNVGDGFSVDEAGPGSVEGSLKNLQINWPGQREALGFPAT